MTYSKNIDRSADRTPTGRPTTDRLCPPTETIERISLLNDLWLPHHELAIPIDDVGFRQGVTAVERLRTYHRRVFAIEEHLKRWRSTLESLGIDDSLSDHDLTRNIQTLLERNGAWIDKSGDVGITMVATPGSGVPRRHDGPTSTFVLHLNPLDHTEIQRRRDQGQPLVISQVTQPAPSCWPRGIKVRSRIHYYLADRQARASDSHALGVLRDTDGSITETSVCNVAIVTDGRIISPPNDRILPGVTQSVVERCAGEASIPWEKRPITPGELSGATEVLLMGTDIGLWYANQIDEKPIGQRLPGSIYLQLRDRFDACTTS